MREQWHRVRNSPAYQRLSLVWRWWGIAGEQYGRFTLLTAVVLALVALGQFLWGAVLRDWPPYALYMTTMLTLGVGALVVLVATLAARGQVIVNIGTTTDAPAAIDPGPPLETRWAGVRWRWNAGRVVALCPTHQEAQLLFAHESRENDVRERLPNSSRSFMRDWLFFCPSGEGHTVLLDDAQVFSDDAYDAAALIAGHRLREMRRSQA